MTIEEKREIVYSFCDSNTSSCALCILNCNEWKHLCISRGCPDIENMSEQELDRALMMIRWEKKQESRGKTNMTYEEAKRILHPDTTLEALAEIERRAGLTGDKAARDAVDDACLIACEALDKEIPKKPLEADDFFLSRSCPVCGKLLSIGYMTYCCKCGNKLDWTQ